MAHLQAYCAPWKRARRPPPSGMPRPRSSPAPCGRSWVALRPSRGASAPRRSGSLRTGSPRGRRGLPVRARGHPTCSRGCRPAVRLAAPDRTCWMRWYLSGTSRWTATSMAPGGPCPSACVATDWTPGSGRGHGHRGGAVGSLWTSSRTLPPRWARRPVPRPSSSAQVGAVVASGPRSASDAPRLPTSSTCPAAGRRRAC